METKGALMNLHLLVESMEARLGRSLSLSEKDALKKGRGYLAFETMLDYINDPDNNASKLESYLSDIVKSI